MANLKALPAKDLEIESRLLSTPPLEAVKSALEKVRQIVYINNITQVSNQKVIMNNIFIIID